MKKGTGFYKVVSVCYYFYAALFFACLVALAFVWMLLISASGLMQVGFILGMNGVCIIGFCILMGIMMLQIHAACILWDMEKRDKVVYTFHQVAAVLLSFIKVSSGMVGQYFFPRYLWAWILYDLFMVATSILGILAFAKIKREMYYIKTANELDQGKRIGLLAIEGDYKGDFFQIFPCEKVVLGTSPQASNVLFDDRQISRRHCIIEYVPEQQMYYITDCSTNGTFLNDGSRMPENTPYPCAPRTRFYFGAKRQMFELV